jgi:hypothetical protein
MPKEGFVGHIPNGVGKGDKRRPSFVSQDEMDKNCAQVFGEEWLIPPVLRRRRSQHESNTETNG